MTDRVTVRQVRGGRWTLRGTAAPSRPGYWQTRTEALEAAESVADNADREVLITVVDPFTDTEEMHVRT